MRHAPSAPEVATHTRSRCATDTICTVAPASGARARLSYATPDITSVLSARAAGGVAGAAGRGGVVGVGRRAWAPAPLASRNAASAADLRSADGMRGRRL